MSNSLIFVDFVSLGLIQNLEILASDNNCVLWIRNNEFDQQLYVSNTYSDLFNQTCVSLYAEPLSWSKSLNIKDADTLSKKLKRQRLINENHTAIYCLEHADGQQTWFQDRSFHLLTTTSNKKIIAGGALCVSDKQFFDNDQQNINDKLDFIITKFYQILTTMLKPIMNHDVVTKRHLLEKLSRREKEIFLLFIQGKTISQVATIIHLSPRTIEGYLITLKSKLECESKSDLIMKAIENGWILLNL